MALTGISVEMFSKVLPNDGLKVLDMHYASSVSRRACITPCSMMLAMVYLDQLRHKNPQYMTSVSSCDLFLVSMLVASKFLYDDGEEDEVFNNEWAASANMELKDLNVLEREFLDALVIAVSAIAYIAAALTLFGSAVLVHRVAHTGQQLLQCSSLGNHNISFVPPHSNASIILPCVVPPFLSSCTDKDREDTVECVPDKPFRVSNKPCKHSKSASNLPTHCSVSVRTRASRVCIGAHRCPLVATCVEVTFSL
ncbi:hypothetical protein HPB50_002059 [Hyalomma asiaticum]|uniref:Uncharacterized protein n=1 Tax=Hyalomma asiaticum TaxID=266040 RepID=A0ACB7TH41_HYAAI|nr:hypothetical protein HPB50_002059 [Hyalomma asiaticum]